MANSKENSVSPKKVAGDIKNTSKRKNIESSNSSPNKKVKSHKKENGHHSKTQLLDSPSVSNKKRNNKEEVVEIIDSENDSINKEKNNSAVSRNGKEFVSPNKEAAGVKKKRTRRKSVQNQEDIEENLRTETISEFKEADLNILLNNISEEIPENDDMMFKLRAREIDWDKVAFKDYSPKLCKDVWYMIQGQLRQNRTLHELVDDAREWASIEWKEKLKPKIHPDFPERPLTTAYLLYFYEAKNHILNIKPNLDHTIINKLAKKVFATIEPEKIKYYETVAANNKKKYEEAVEAFYECYPDLRKRQIEEKVLVQTKPCTPFALFLQEQRLRLCKDLDKAVVNEALKEEWKGMEGKEKLPYIDMALELFKKCSMEADPDDMLRLILTKDEIKIKEEMMGLPQKPPSSAYAYYSQLMFKTNEDLKKIPHTERLRRIGAMWKELSEAEKNEHKVQQEILQKKYKKQYEEYKNKMQEDDLLEYYQEQVKRIKQLKAKTPNIELSLGNISLAQNESIQVLNSIIPETWMEMTPGEKQKFLDFIKEIIKCFDKKMHRILHGDDKGENADETSSKTQKENNRHGSDKEINNDNVEISDDDDNEVSNDDNEESSEDNNSEDDDKEDDNSEDDNKGDDNSESDES